MSFTLHSRTGEVLATAECPVEANMALKATPEAVLWRTADGALGGYKTKPKREESAPFVLPRRRRRVE